MALPGRKKAATALNGNVDDRVNARGLRFHDGDDVHNGFFRFRGLHDCDRRESGRDVHGRKQSCQLG